MITPEDIKNLIDDFILNYKDKNAIITDWADPIVGFASTDDSLFLQLKQVIDQDHKHPNQLLPSAKTVISYFIPFNENIVQSNIDGKLASKEWAIAYIETNKLITDINKFLTAEIKQENYDSFEIPPTHNFDENKLVSYWSHKHIAYIAGLGKFGLHKMLITEKGCCGRLGSLIISAKIEATGRNEDEYCLYFFNKTCKQCLDKCLFNALYLNSFDRHKCYKICLENGRIYSKLGLSDICGKCACGIPCSVNNPVKLIGKYKY